MLCFFNRFQAAGGRAILRNSSVMGFEMPNGKPGDHPFTDIVVHGRDVYSPKAAELVREIANLADDKQRRALADLLFSEFNEFYDPDVEKLERFLTDMRNKLLEEARERGFEV
ncbi:hypothetical protein [Pelagibius marinus]|uniref:hypothetical protein n=1 Tax=Pelagibius marinus TaxID=2762760 RepID=UPI001872F8A4|nr:hypothetical protein [Pelagibius marinus]